jgi:hypothetical protein
VKCTVVMPSVSAISAGMLTASAAEADQRVLGDVIAALDRDLLDRVGHVLTAIFKKPSAISSGFLPSPISSASAAKRSAHGIGIQRLS